MCCMSWSLYYRPCVPERTDRGTLFLLKQFRMIANRSFLGCDIDCFTYLVSSSSRGGDIFQVRRSRKWRPLALVARSTLIGRFILMKSFQRHNFRCWVFSIQRDLNEIRPTEVICQRYTVVGKRTLTPPPTHTIATLFSLLSVIRQLEMLRASPLYFHVIIMMFFEKLFTRKKFLMTILIWSIFFF